MTKGYNADEVFEIAETLERNAAAFYRAAAEKAADPAIRKLLLNLAEWETSHEKVVARFRGGLAEEGKLNGYDPAGDAALYLRAVADSHALRSGKHAGGVLAGDESIEQILQIGLGFEMDAVLFYSGLRNAVPADWERDWVDRIIAEEQRHVVYLSDQLAALRGR